MSKINILIQYVGNWTIVRKYCAKARLEPSRGKPKTCCFMSAPAPHDIINVLPVIPLEASEPLPWTYAFSCAQHFWAEVEQPWYLQLPMISFTSHSQSQNGLLEFHCKTTNTDILFPTLANVWNLRTILQNPMFLIYCTFLPIHCMEWMTMPKGRNTKVLLKTKTYRNLLYHRSFLIDVDR